MSIDLSQKISTEKRDVEAVQRTNLNQMESYTTTKSSSSFDSKGCAIVRSYSGVPPYECSIHTECQHQSCQQWVIPSAPVISTSHT